MRHTNTDKTEVRFTVNSQKDFEEKVKSFSKTNQGVHVVDVVFDTVFINTFKFKSQVPPSRVEFSRGFWKEGSFHEWTSEFKSKKVSQTKSNKKTTTVFVGG